VFEHERSDRRPFFGSIGAMRRGEIDWGRELSGCLVHGKLSPSYGADHRKVIRPLLAQMDRPRSRVKVSAPLLIPNPLVMN
jgi:hypothetical protein